MKMQAEITGSFETRSGDQCVNVKNLETSKTYVLWKVDDNIYWMENGTVLNVLYKSITPSTSSEFKDDWIFQHKITETGKKKE